MTTYTHIKILKSHFMQSAQTIKDCPPSHCTEVAILGRSNVGKSSIINLLLNHKLAKSSSTPGKTKFINFFSTTWELFANTKQNPTTAQVKTEIYAKQGFLSNSKSFANDNEVATKSQKDSMQCQEQLLQTESIRIPLVFIDFPGFGYAKVSRDTKKNWDKHLTDFLCKRQSIKLFCHLIDARHRDLAIDLEITSFLQTIIESRKDCKLLHIYTKDDKLGKSDYHKLRAQNKLTVSIFKKTPQTMQRLYHAILYASLDW